MKQEIHFRTGYLRLRPPELSIFMYEQELSEGQSAKS